MNTSSELWTRVNWAMVYWTRVNCRGAGGRVSDIVTGVP